MKKDEKMIVIVDEGIKVHGLDEDEIMVWLLQAVVEAFDKQNGPIDKVQAGKRVIDVLFEATRNERIDMIFEAIFGDDDDEDDEDEYEEDD